MAELIPIQTAAGVSADFVLAAASPRTLNLKSASALAGFGPGAMVEVQILSGGQYFTFGSLSAATPVLVLDAVGTFRLNKPASTVAYGVDGS